MKSCWLAGVFLLASWVLYAQDAADLFASTIAPAFETNCLGCHGESMAMAKLDLRTRQSMLKGGTRGPALVPGSAEKSSLYEALVGNGTLQMPPGGPTKRLQPEVIAAVKRWIEEGAPVSEAKSVAADRTWGTFKEEDIWAFRPIRKNFSNKNIDGFIQTKLVERGLTPAPRADRAPLIRRVTIDLTGLPPTPEEVAEFVNDKSPDAWPKVIDRLLASPRYGERWGRHWLDVARYADTAGYSNDFERPNAWRYRDYVIRSFNSNKPYDRFILEQIAGDELFPQDAEALIATGFLRSGPWEHTAMSVEAVTRQMFLDDVTHNTAAVFLGVTLGCAKCHDHKFDPIPTRDYYSMQAVFATTEFVRPKLDFLPGENTGDMKAGKDRLEEIVRRIQERVSRLDTLMEKRLLEEKKVARVEDLPAGVLADAKKNQKGLTPAEFEEYKLHRKHLQIYAESLERFSPKAFAVSSGPRDGEGDGGGNLKYPKRSDYKAQQIHILPGGNIQAPGETVSPGALSAVGRYAAMPAPQIPETVEGRRAALAKWIADPKNPLTPRVMVNRIWQYHFGTGIAPDTNNFGKSGRKPSHPELLDWLAQSFVNSGWDVKAMHRLILSSEAYQRASSHPKLEVVREKDPENRLLSYFSPRRIEAEVLRDGILAVAGELSSESGGPGVFPQINEDVAQQPRHAMGSLQPQYYASAQKRLRNRRTIYTFQQRSLIDPMVDVFNGPSLDMSCERRNAATLPTQAFTLFNGQFANDMALALAVKSVREEKTARGRVSRAFLATFGRAPDDREMGLALAHMNKMAELHRRTPPPPKSKPKPIVHTITSELTGENFAFEQQPDTGDREENIHSSEVDAETRALADLTLALFNSNEFLYIY